MPVTTPKHWKAYPIDLAALAIVREYHRLATDADTYRYLLHAEMKRIEPDRLARTKKGAAK